ncbi:hypothetical protein CAPTEDRAFT_199975 [Capitella teleta]|uniref:Uncharacterized protein n=1 Tax=Capitella teleta TaxID=283909 RepID=R7TFH8_CAPTE|nr:hypothetical protein CAPTEDRAFT_199975 [Capitella teleta]|eukprot:ELT92252.1 hypothetical protein CAPTEDRAFT_199975 [Capitella teleta]
MSQTPTCTVNYLCIGALLVFVGSILLCTLGFTVILPYESTRNWTQVNCTVVNASYNRHLCSCQRSLTDYEPCNSKYPCLQVYVSFSTAVSDQVLSTVENNPSTVWNTFTDDIAMVNATEAPLTIGYDNSSSTELTTEAHLVDSDEGITFMKHNLMVDEPQSPSTSAPEPPVITTQLYRSWSDAFHKKCSLQECSDEEWNYKQTARFHSEWGQAKTSFPCFYDPSDANIVIATRTPFSAMLQAVLWSCSCLALGAVVWIGLCCGICSMEASASDADEALIGVKPLPA